MQSDFSQGKVWKNVINQAVPLMAAQLIQIMYNVVDRIYIGHLPVIGSDALTGIGLVFPITTLIAAFTNLFSPGAVPLFSIRTYCHIAYNRINSAYCFMLHFQKACIVPVRGK